MALKPSITIAGTGIDTLTRKMLVLHDIGETVGYSGQFTVEHITSSDPLNSTQIYANLIGFAFTRTTSDGTIIKDTDIANIFSSISITNTNSLGEVLSSGLTGTAITDGATALKVYGTGDMAATTPPTTAVPFDQTTTFTIDYTINPDIYSEKITMEVVSKELIGDDTAVLAENSIIVNDTLNNYVITELLTVEEAFRNYEDLVNDIATEDLEVIRNQYDALDSMRATIYTAINALEDGTYKTECLERYAHATALQYNGYAMLLLYDTRESDINVVSLKNVGGNRPFLFEIMTPYSLLSASKAIMFYSEIDGTTGEALYHMVDFSSTITDATKFTLPDNMHSGENIIFVEVGTTWYKMYITVNETNQITKLNSFDVSIPEIGNTFNTPSHAAMLGLVDTVVLSSAFDKSVYDKIETMQLTVNSSFPIISGDIPISYNYGYKLTAPFLNTGLIIDIYRPVAEEELALVKSITLAEDITSLVLTDLTKNLSTITGSDDFILKFSNMTYVGASNATITVIAGEPSYLDSQYTIKSTIGESTIIDRQAALDDAIANTTVSYTGDVVQTEAETIALAVTTVFPTFLPALDPDLKLDTLLTFSLPLPVGSVLELKSGETSLGVYTTTESNITKLWFTNIIGESSVREPLSSKNNSTTEYTVILSNFESRDYNLRVQVITAKADSFDTVAEHTMSMVDIAMQVTDKSELVTLISEANALIGRVSVGTDPGQVPQSAYDNFQTAINTANAVNSNGDATLTDIANAITALNTAMDTFSTFIIKMVTDKSALLTALNLATSLESTTIGSSTGNIPNQSYIDTLTAAKLVAQGVYDTEPNEYDPTDPEDTTQNDVNLGTTNLQNAITAFQSAIITDVQYVETNLQAYEAAATAFMNSIRKKINI